MILNNVLLSNKFLAYAHLSLLILCYRLLPCGYILIVLFQSIPSCRLQCLRTILLLLTVSCLLQFLLKWLLWLFYITPIVGSFLWIVRAIVWANFLSCTVIYLLLLLTCIILVLMLSNDIRHWTEFCWIWHNRF